MSNNSEIKFKSRNKAPVVFLSNFYGGSEFTYHSQRTRNPTLKKLYLDLRDNMTYDQYKVYRERLMILYPKGRARKTIFKDGYRDAYMKDFGGEQYYGFGIVAKLISACYKPAMKKRLMEVNWIAQERFGDEATPILADDFLESTDQEKWDYMLVALRIKFQKEPYKSYLMSTAGKKLYEAEGHREGKNVWAGKDGILGKLLMKVRDELLLSELLLSDSDSEEDDELGSVLGKRKSQVANVTERVTERLLTEPSRVCFANVTPLKF